MLRVTASDADDALAFSVPPLEDEAVLADRFDGSADFHGMCGVAEGEESGFKRASRG